MPEITKEQLELLNSYLLGQHTSWQQMGATLFALLLVSVVIYALVVTFCDDKKSDSEEQDHKRKEATKKAVSMALMVSGLAAMAYGIVLILSM